MNTASQVLEKGGVQRGSRTLQRPQGFVEEVLNIIRSDILSLRIPPETRISIDQLARELGVSQTPIREALSMLEAMGLVTKRHCVGYCSAPQLSRQQLDDLHELRQLLEPHAARRTAQQMTPGLADTLRRLDDAMKRCERSESCDLFNQLDSELHGTIADGSGNPIIQKSLSRIHTHFHMHNLRFGSEACRDVDAEHERLVEALIRGDANGAEQAMRAHIEKAYERLLPFTLA